jgi:hypothetical protein
MRYDIVELNTSVKPFFFKYFFDQKKYESLIYMDPDIQVFSEFSELENELKSNDIVITPHFFTPLNDDKWQAEEDFLNSGLYNLGFIAINTTGNGLAMINWWAKRLITKAYINFSRGLFTDQIWVNFAPLFFEKVKILKHLGYNVAYWNLHERKINTKNNKYYINSDVPLVFFHYASYRPLNPSLISSGQRRYTFDDRPDITPLFDNYRNILLNGDYKRMNSVPCYFYQKKNEIENAEYKKKVRKYPLYKKVLGKIVRVLIEQFKLVLDYTEL